MVQSDELNSKRRVHTEDAILRGISQTQEIMNYEMRENQGESKKMRQITQCIEEHRIRLVSWTLNVEHTSVNYVMLVHQ